MPSNDSLLDQPCPSEYSRFSQLLPRAGCLRLKSHLVAQQQRQILARMQCSQCSTRTQPRCSPNVPQAVCSRLTISGVRKRYKPHGETFTEQPFLKLTARSSKFACKQPRTQLMHVRQMPELPARSVEKWPMHSGHCSD